MNENGKTGHRERLKERFIIGEVSSRSEEALLELLLTFAIPQKDVQPLSKKLLEKFGNLDSVMNATVEDICKIDGIKQHSAILIKLVNEIRKIKYVNTKKILQDEQTLLFENIKKDKDIEQIKPVKTKAVAKERSGLIAKAILKETIDILPKLPDTESIPEIRQFLKSNLHFSAAETRRRYSDYMIFRMFPDGIADKALRYFAANYISKQELRDVAFYRFCKAEPLMNDVVIKLLIPAIGAGKLNRQSIFDFVADKYPNSKSIGDCSRAIVEALTAGGIVHSDRNNIYFMYRDILRDSFAFILHSEYPEPGMYDLSSLENNISIKTILWNPTRILPSLYELRNRYLISKISEIDSVRQFTTKMTLESIVTEIVSRGSKK